MFSTVHTNRYVFDENARRIGIDGKPKRIEMYAFSNENALVWTGPKTEKLSVFQNVPLRVDGAVEKMRSNPRFQFHLRMALYLCCSISFGNIYFGNL